MKKILASVLSVCLLAGAAGTTAFAADEADVFVTIADKDGNLVLTQEPITVSDIDADGALTINDALIIAHDSCYDGGAEAGYGSVYGSYGLSMTKFWGTENGGCYGYRVNDISAWSLADPVTDGDYINAYVYTDLTAWSDTYCWFETDTVAAESGEEINLTLTASGYDESWNPVEVPVEGAVITVNGQTVKAQTDAEGKAVITLDKAGEYVISAFSENQILVPPICVATITEALEADAYVSVSDAEGNLVLAHEAVTVTDIDADGALTINDALYIVHEKNYDGGAAAGYGSVYGEYGLSLNKLWGVENGGSYGYYVNNKSAWSLADPIVDGDHIKAFVYTDLTAWSDKYCWFETDTVSAKSGESITLNLVMAGYDAAWNPVAQPVEGAVITLNGEATEFITDADGKVTIVIDKAGEYVISAVSESLTLVPPVCEVSVEAADAPVVDEDSIAAPPKTGEKGGSSLFFAAVLMGAAALLKRRVSHEK